MSEKFLPSPITPENIKFDAVQTAHEQAIIEMGPALQRRIDRQEMHDSIDNEEPRNLDSDTIKQVGDVAITTARLARSTEFQANWELAA